MHLYCAFNRFSLKAPPGGTKPFGAGVTSSEGYLLALWVHECRRVFADKLISHEDKSWVDRAITDLCRQEFPVELCKQVWQYERHTVSSTYSAYQHAASCAGGKRWLDDCSANAMSVTFLSKYSVLYNSHQSC